MLVFMNLERQGVGLRNGRLQGFTWYQHCHHHCRHHHHHDHPLLHPLCSLVSFLDFFGPHSLYLRTGFLSLAGALATGGSKLTWSHLPSEWERKFFLPVSDLVLFGSYAWYCTCPWTRYWSVVGHCCRRESGLPWWEAPRMRWAEGDRSTSSRKRRSARGTGQTEAADDHSIPPLSSTSPRILPIYSP